MFVTVQSSKKSAMDILSQIGSSFGGKRKSAYLGRHGGFAEAEFGRHDWTGYNPILANQSDLNETTLTSHLVSKTELFPASII